MSGPVRPHTPPLPPSASSYSSSPPSPASGSPRADSESGSSGGGGTSSSNNTILTGTVGGGGGGLPFFGGGSSLVGGQGGGGGGGGPAGGTGGGPTPPTYVSSQPLNISAESTASLSLSLSNSSINLPPTLPLTPPKSSREVFFETPQDTTPSKAKVIRHYILGDQLGEGSYAKVFEGLDSVSLKRVAIKVIKRSSVRSKFGATAEKNVQQEIAIMRRLKHHPNVVGTIDVFESSQGKKIYLVLELICGASLLEVMGAHSPAPMPSQQIHHYFTQILSALDYIHRCGVVHRDLKPGNIMVDVNHNIKIYDFGISQILNPFNPKDTCSQYLGTPAFQPPEIALCAPRFSGFKSDIWALGVTMYYLATATHPFQGVTVFQLLDNIGKGVYEIPDYVDPLYASLIRGLMEPDVRLRYDLEMIKNHPWVLSEEFSGLPNREPDSRLHWMSIPYNHVKMSVLPVARMVCEDMEASQTLMVRGRDRHAELYGASYVDGNDENLAGKAVPGEDVSKSSGDELDQEEVWKGAAEKAEAHHSSSLLDDQASDAEKFRAPGFESSMLPEDGPVFGSNGGMVLNGTLGGKSSALWSRVKEMVAVSSPLSEKEPAESEEELNEPPPPDEKKAWCSIQ